MGQGAGSKPKPGCFQAMGQAVGQLDWIRELVQRPHRGVDLHVGEVHRRRAELEGHLVPVARGAAGCSGTS
jgi:hypothetical protein